MYSAILPNMKKQLKNMIYLLIASIVACVYLVWTPDQDLTQLKEKYAQAPSKFINLAGTNLHYRDSGNKNLPALVFLHGFGASLHTWEAWSSELEKDYRVIRMDLPGFGLSGMNETNDFSDAHDIAVILGLLKEVGVEKATFIGNSLGGKLAWHIAAAHPERVEKLVLISPDGFASEGFEYDKASQASWMLSVMTIALPKPLLKMSLVPAYADANVLRSAMVDRYYDLMCAPGVRKSIVARVKQTVLKDPIPLLKAIQADTLLMWGEQDGMIPIVNAQEYVKNIPSVRLEVLPKTGHLPQEENVQASLQVLKKFLNR
jgi:pimeloyl-ACP methyl ester carboxylesterase